jgi:regulator of cell morphogenesis and NO signaling
MTATLETSVRDIVSADFRTAAVLHRFGIDFCCGGGRTLAEACHARHVDAHEVLSQVNQLDEDSGGAAPRFVEWEPGRLIDHIVGTHHGYVRQALPSVVAHVRKVAASHGAAHPEWLEISAIFESVAGELTSHMAKEEHVLFPYIRAAAEARRVGIPAPKAPFGTIENPIRMMEHEHESAGAGLARIRELTADYSIPAGVCATYGVCVRELEAFEHDLHTHVHLENNILFPAARNLVPSTATF